MEKTRTAQQTEIQTLQSQIQSLQLTVNTLGSFMSQLVDTNHNIDMPGDIRRMVQQISDNMAAATRKKPIFLDRRIGKSMSVNAQLGFPLKVLEELNESSEGVSSPKATAGKSSFFENTYEHIRQQNKVRPNRLVDSVSSSIDMKLPEHVEKAIESMAHGKKQKSMQPLTDSGISTPISPPNLGLMMPPIVETKAMTTPANIAVEEPTHFSEMHPLSNCEDVNFKFNGTTQLKSLRPLHQHVRPVSNSQHTAGTDDNKNQRS